MSDTSVPMGSTTPSLFHLLVSERQDPLSFLERQTEMSSFVDDLRSRGHFHFRRATTGGCAPVVQLLRNDGRTSTACVNLASNDYLNLTRHPAVLKASVDATMRYGAGTGGSPAAIGNTELHEQLEQALARFTGCEAALLYSSGYGMNCGVLSSLLRRNDLAIVDSAVHASIMDGCRTAQTRVFDHNDPDSLSRLLARSTGRYANRLVIVEGVYSMDGDLARLGEIVDLAHAHGAWVMLDEAHATGVVGANGRGTAEHFGLLGKIDIVAGTFSKSLGSVGGFVAGSEALVRYLQMASRPYVFSAAPLASVVAGVLAALEVIEREPERRKSLWHNVSSLREALLSEGFDLGRSESAILPLMVRDDMKVKELCRLLHDDGILVTPVIFPGVPTAESRVRLSVSSALEQTHLDQAFSALRRHGRALGIV